MLRKGFTLAEVLITLTIIGVVAAITVPALIQRTNKQEYAAALQKAYSVLSQAANMIIAEEGSPKAADGGWAVNTKAVYDMFKKHLNSLKECRNEEGCILQEYYKSLAKGRKYGNFNTADITYKLAAADGMQIIFENMEDVQNAHACSFKANGSENYCMQIYVDLNGAKEPNTFGRDVFVFVLKENGLYPAGCDDKEYICGGGEGQGSFGCACKVLREGAMNY